MSGCGYKQPSGWLVIFGCFGAQSGHKPRHLFTAAFDPEQTSCLSVKQRHNEREIVNFCNLTSQHTKNRYMAVNLSNGSPASEADIQQLESELGTGLT